MMPSRWCLLPLLVLACGDPPESGDPCLGGGECTDDLLCLLSEEGTSGECTPLPADCADYPKCTDPCFQAFMLENCQAGGECSSVSGRVTVTCKTAP